MNKLYVVLSEYIDDGSVPIAIRSTREAAERRLVELANLITTENWVIETTVTGETIGYTSDGLASMQVVEVEDVKL